MIGPGHHDPLRADGAGENRARLDRGRSGVDRRGSGRGAPDGVARAGTVSPGVMWPGAAHVGAAAAGTRADASGPHPLARRADAARPATPSAGAGAAVARGGDDGAVRADPADHARATRRGLTVLGVLAALGCLQLLFMIGVELDRTLRHQASIAALEAELAELDREVEGLEAVIGHADDPVYREQLARRQGFMAAGESRVVVLPDATP